MSWSLTLDNIDYMSEIPDELLGKLSEDNPLYAQDAKLAFETAKVAGLVSATIAGGRTPNPYGGADVAVITVTGFDSRRESHAVPRGFNDDMAQIVVQPELDDYDYDQEDDGISGNDSAGALTADDLAQIEQAANGWQRSLKCKVYGHRTHDPCVGTTDDGRELPCTCWCHSGT